MTSVEAQWRIAYHIAKGMAKLGVVEVPGKVHNEIILSFHAVTKLRATSDETHWCSAFVNWCFVMGAYAVNPRKTEAELLKTFADYEVHQFRKSLDMLVSKSILMPVEWSERPDTENVVMPTFNAMARSFVLFGKKSTNPAEGDVVVFERGNDGVSGHVGFLGPKGIGVLYVDTLGGNQDNQVSFKPYPKTKLLTVRKAG